MNLAPKMRLALILVVVFVSTFFIAILIFSSTQSAYSTPDNNVLQVEDITITIDQNPTPPISLSTPQFQLMRFLLQHGATYKQLQNYKSVV